MVTQFERHYESSTTKLIGGTVGNYFCQSRDNTLRPPTSKSMAFSNTESKTLVKGDRVHALPFTGEYRESVPMSGRFTARAFYNTDRNAVDFTYCGEPGTTEVWSGDIGMWITNPASLAFLPKDAALMRQLKGLADTKALADLRRSYVNVPLLIAERRETVGLIATKAKQLTALIQARQRSDLVRYYQTRKSDRRRVYRDIANEHLAFLFGVLPLVAEAEGLCSLLQEDKTVVLTGRGRASQMEIQRVNADSIPTGTNVASPYVAAYRAQRELYKRYSHRTSLRTKIDVVTAARLRDWGFNPVATAYDFIPLSFLCDFVSNLGTFLRSYDPLVGVTFETGSSTSWREAKETLTVTGANASYTTSNGRRRTLECSGAGTGFTRSLIVEREVLKDFPEASLMFVNNMSYGKAATIAALAVQRYVKPVRRLIARKPFRYRGKRPVNLPNINYN